jgi:heme a synthase
MTSPQKTYLRWLTLTLFLTFDLIVFGAYVRLSDSGLGCPDWPGCYAQATPWQAHASISLAETLQPDGPVTHFKAWVEMIHRYIAMTLGVLCVGLCASSIVWKKHLSIDWKLPAFTVFWVCLQGAFGQWTVTLKLMPIIVTGHLIGGLVLLSLLAWQHVRLNMRLTLQTTSSPSSALPYQSWSNWVRLLLFVLTVQIILGGWVSTHYAALACPTIPLCQGVWIPDMDFAHGFTLWRDLHNTGTRSTELPFQALVAIHWLHRSSAMMVLLVAVLVLLKLKQARSFKDYRRGIMGVLTLQIFTGISTVVFNYPLLAAVLHTAGAASLLLITVRLLASLHENLRVQRSRSVQ